jgi:hydroxyacylglutathione hydrolase
VHEVPTPGSPAPKAWRYGAPAHPRIRALRAFSDNYIWAIVSQDGQRAVVVDPGDPSPVLAMLQAQGLSLAAIVLTHHHPDHIGGVQALAQLTGAMRIGPDDARMGALDKTAGDGETVELPGMDLTLKALAVPGHTLSHLAWFAQAFADDPREIVFSGDTLFAGGCGRLFEGSPAQMRASLSRLRALPPRTLVYCAHEYTVSNLKFAHACDPGNAAVTERLAEALQMREADLSTVPSTLAVECLTNPFLRWDTPAIRAAAQAHAAQPPTDDDAVFAAIRQWKNEFR